MAHPERYFNYAFFRLLQVFSRTQATKFYHKKITGETLDLIHPKTFSHKLQWLKLYDHNPLKTRCADKYLAREYVRDCGYEDILNNLIFVCDHTKEIDWDSLPETFVLKCNHGSGYNVICNDKSKLDKQAAVKKLNKWLRTDFGRLFCEPHYSPIPRKIICETYLKPDKGLLPVDYKFFCFNGRPEYLVVAADRDWNLNYSTVDRNWNKVDIFQGDITSPTLAIKPENFSRMLACAETLAKPFAFVRVDFYNYNGRLIFGEMTFTPSMCMSRNHSAFAQQHFGELITLPETASGKGRKRK